MKNPVILETTSVGVSILGKAYHTIKYIIEWQLIIVILKAPYVARNPSCGGERDIIN